MEEYKVDVPEGQSGDWKVEKFEVTEEDAKWERMRSTFSFSSRGRGVPAGWYTRITRGGSVIMSDTPDEIYDVYSMIYHATGNILINGLGLGVVLNACLMKPEVTHATVIEISPDVIELVGPHYQQRFGDRVSIIADDAFTYKPNGQRFGAVWHDIWDNICSDNLPQMHKLHRKYGRKTDWQGSWCRERAEMGR